MPRPSTPITRHCGLGAYADWPEEQRVDVPRRGAGDGRPMRPPTDLPCRPEVADVLADVPDASRAIPPESLGAYVITMAAQPSDVLAVELLQRRAGVDPPLRVVPLFETARDLRAAGDVIDRLLRSRGIAIA